MKRKIIYVLPVLACTLFSSCNDYLDTVNYSLVDDNFVYQSDYEADKLVLGVYTYMRSSSQFHGNGLFYDWISANSDFEIMPEAATANARYNGANLWPNAVNISSSVANIGQWDNMYNLINKCNILLNGFENSPTFKEQWNAPGKTPLTSMYAEVATIRAIAYYELTRLWGDCFYSTKPIVSQEEAYSMKIVDRNDIQEAEIEHLQSVVSKMFKIGENGMTAERLTSGAAYSIIARLAIIRGGYSLRPANWDMSQFESPIQSDATWGKLARRSDWTEWYKVANKALKEVCSNSGASIITTGDNPFQQVFQDMMNLVPSRENIFEIAEVPSLANSERPYAFGRPSNGSNGLYPPKSYGQTRYLPWYYWGAFDPKDLRRDVSVTVSGLSGSPGEVLLPWIKGNAAIGGGPSLNKWDYSRQPEGSFSVTASVQRRSGINGPYIRLADMILLLAETEAYLAQAGVAGYSTANALVELNKIRSRAFSAADQAKKVTDYLAGLTTADAVIQAIQDERMFELTGEGARKYDLIRWGLFGERVNWVQNEMDATLDDLQTKGYREYANGNQFPAYVYVKHFTGAEAKALGMTTFLTTNMPLDVDPAKDQLTDLQALLIPGWRGNANWDNYAGRTLDYSCMAIQGLFRYIAPGSAEAFALEAKGYERTAYGMDMIYTSTIVDAEERRTSMIANWQTGAAGTFGGYMPNDYAAGKPPRYLIPIPNTTISYSGGIVANQYGYPQQ